MRRYQRVGGDVENFQRYMHYVLEAGRKIGKCAALLENQSKRIVIYVVKNPAHQVCIIVDMTGFSMSQVEWTLGPIMHELMFQYYPQSVHSCKISPSIPR